MHRAQLALTSQSAVERKSRKPAASVVLNLYSCRIIDDANTAGIVNIVASSVPGLSTEQVTVVDDKGRLLSSKGGQSNMMLGSTQFE